MQNLVKMASGVKNIQGLRAGQMGRLDAQGRMLHVTRNMPKQADEIMDGGSLYWVAGRAMCGRQRVLDIRAAKDADDRKFTILVLDPEVIAVEPTPYPRIQGWRYLDPAAAPRDLGDLPNAESMAEMPEAMRRELRALCLL